MRTPSTIRRTSPADPALDFAGLRAEGIRHLERLTGGTWTDFNLHDPGITILEVLCYALVDLGYRTAFPFGDLLASGDGAGFEPFGGALEMLPSRPVTPLDYRKLLLDLPGVRNAWVQRATGVELFADLREEKLALAPPDHANFKTVELNGLYRILLELQPEADEEAVKTAARAAYQAHRNLGEDLHDVRLVPTHHLVLCADLDLRPDADPARVLAEARIALDGHLAPPLLRYPLTELLQKPKADGSLRTVDEILEGTPPQKLAGGRFNGFFDDDALRAADLPDAVFASDLVRILMDVEGVIGVRSLQLNDADDPVAPDGGQPWQVGVKPGHRPAWVRTTPTRQDYRYLHFYKDNLLVPPDAARADALETELQSAQMARQRRFSRADLEPQPPVGRVRDLRAYVPLAHDLPLVYGVGPAGLPATATPERRGQARQLQAYLALFDQMLANYAAQLNRVHALFSVENALGRTYFTQVVESDPALWEHAGELATVLDELAEPSDPENSDPEKQKAILALALRRNRLFDHLLTRVAESFNEYALRSVAAEDEEPLKKLKKLVAEKAAFLREYPTLSRDRGGATDVTNPANGVSGFEQRLRLLLGLGDDEILVLIEHHLLRPHPDWAALPTLPGGTTALLLSCVDDGCADCGGLDPYSLRLTVVFPAEAPRFRREDAAQQLAFRQYVERVVRLELPAHLLPKVCWVSNEGMEKLKTAWRVWREARLRDDFGGEPGREATAAMVGLLTHLTNLYPKGTLLDQNNPGTPDEHPIVLGRTALGTLG
jgi:hypothetical protein